jgi:hypothetical protein
VLAPGDEPTAPQPKSTAPLRPTESASPPVLVAPMAETPLTLAPLAPKLALQTKLPEGSSLAMARSDVPMLVSGPPPKSTVPEKVVASSTFSAGSTEKAVEAGSALLQRQAPVASRSVSTVLVTEAVPTVPQPWSTVPVTDVP